MAKNARPRASDDPDEAFRDLTPLMRPQSIAVVGASQREVRANRVIRTLQAVGYSGAIYPINPNYSKVLGLPCFPDLASTPQPADCAVVAIPARRVGDVLTLGAEVGVRASIVLASGFGESGEEGQALQRQLEQLSHDRGLLICGPNCFGVLNVSDRTAPFIGVIPVPLVPGNVALISQSGGLTNVIAPPLMATRGVGFSFVISCGNQAGVTIEDYINFCVDDEKTQVIAAFVEGFRRPRSLTAVARKARARGKPIVILKVGTSEVARRTALAHTGSVVGAADVTEAVLRRDGIVQVRSLNELLETIVLFSIPETRGRFRWGTRAGVITGTGGLMAYLGDVAAEVGVTLPAFSGETQASLAEVLPEFVGATNPLDGTGAMYEDPRIFPGLVSRLADDRAIDLVAIHLDFNPKNADGLDASRRQFVPDLVGLAPTLSKPVIVFTARSGSLIDLDVANSLRSVNVALLDGTEPALMAVRNMSEYQRRQAEPAEVPTTGPAIRTIPGLAAMPPGALDTVRSFKLLSSVGLPVAAVELARSADGAVAAADRMGYPVALKVESPSIQHKTELGGVVLGLRTPQAVRDGYARILEQVTERAPGTQIAGLIVQRMCGVGIEMLLGVKRDPSFGPVVACGLGGVFVEILNDVAVGLPPFSAGQAEEMLRRLRAWPLLDGARGKPRADVDAVVAAVIAMGELALALGDRVDAIDVNPLMVFPAGQGVIAVDALVHLR